METNKISFIIINMHDIHSNKFTKKTKFGKNFEELE